MRALLAIVVLLAAGAAAFLTMPMWLPKFPDGDRALIKYERSQRLMRWSFGLPMPGEPDLDRLPERLADAGVKEGSPILIRIFKSEFELELWMQRDGVFRRFATYAVCRWSGRIGPKEREGDGQAPEGFYTVDSTALNPNSRWYRSFNLGYPNAFDRALGRTGSLIMVHGGCASIGCFAMTNAQMREIWQLVTATLQGGAQTRFQVQVYPFRMTPDRMANYAASPNIGFWKNLKEGSDLFEASGLPPKISTCKGRYQFAPGDKGSTGADSIDDKCTGEAAKS
ncbi:L,D-transpeptidase family protein [Hyphomicrobium sp.]|jgi:murein L,D-transpeptidase YafK|uniref:L,D-transpeptidase family protein n=1 Tax=Hyphomicrobium sp. TaxID=82 RepID=UPI00356B3BD2